MAEFIRDMGLLEEPGTPRRRLPESFVHDMEIIKPARRDPRAQALDREMEAYRAATPEQRKALDAVDRQVDARQEQMQQRREAAQVPSPQMGGIADTRLPTEVGKPVLRNPDGTVSTERTITIEVDGKHYLIPTIINGKEVSEDEAVRQWRAGANKAVGVYGTAEEAEAQAKARSERIGRAVEPLTGRFQELREQAGPRGFTFAGRHVTDPEEKPEEVLSRVPLGELESGARVAMGPIDLQFGYAVGKGAAILALKPKQTAEMVTGALQALPGLAGKYRQTMDRFGRAIVERMPKVFRAGRGTPLEFREARAMMEADVANAIEQGVSLGTKLKGELTRAERMRADQLLRGGISSAEAPLYQEARQSVALKTRGQQLDAKARELAVENEAKQILQDRIKSGRASREERLLGATTPIRQEIDRIQKELVDLGRLAPETVERFQENFGPYLARLYATKEFTAKSPVVVAGTKPVRAGTERLSMRGERVEVEIPDLQDEMKSVSRLLGPESEFRREFRTAAKGLTKKKTTTTAERVTEQQLPPERTVKSTSATTGAEGEFTEVPLSGVAHRLERIVTDALETRGMTGGEARAAIGRVKAAAVKAAEGGVEPPPVAPGFVRYFRADVAGATRPGGVNWGRDRAYVEAKYGAPGSTTLYVDVPQSIADPDNYGVFPALLQGLPDDVLKTAKPLRGEVKITGGGTTKETITETIKERMLRQKETVKTVIESLGVNNAQKAALHAYYDAITRAGAKAKSIKVGDRTYKIDPVMDVESGLERAAALKPLLDAGYKVESRQGNKVTLFRDIPEDIRTAPAGHPVIRGGRDITDEVNATGISPDDAVIDARGRYIVGGQEVGRGMGELRSEPGYTAAKSIGQTGREAAVVKFFKNVSDNPEWTSPTGAKPGFTQMSDDKKRMADLAGKFVRSDIAAEINQATRMKADWEKINNRITSLWKIGKVTNPATMSRNFMSSAMMADWGGLSPWKASGARSYGKAIRGLIGKDAEGATLVNEAKKMGVFRAGFTQAEINALADGYIKSKELNPLLRGLDGLSDMVQRSGVGTAYGSIDNFFKAALYTHGRRELGMTPQLAARYAKKYGIDYGDISPFVRTMREVPLGSPFITFASKAIPLTIETAVKHPVRFWKWPAALLGVNELSKAQFEGEREEIEATKRLGNINAPRWIMLPDKDEEGRYRFLDLGYILPFGDLVEVMGRISGGGSDANVAFEPLGGPYQAIAELAFNKSLFTGRPIWLKTDSYTEQGAKMSDYVLKSLLPALAPPIPGTGFRGGYSFEAFRQAINPEWQLPLETPISKTDFLGRQRDMLATVASKILGLNVKNVSLQDMQRLGLIDFQSRMNELNRQMTRFARMGISDEKKQRKMAELAKKYEALVEQTREKFHGEVETETPEPAPEKSKRTLPPGFVDDLGLMGR